MSLWDRVKDAAREAVDKVADVADVDRALQLAAAAAIERAKDVYPTLPYGHYRPGDPLKLLFAGYSGTRNTGADVRVEEMIRQFRHVLGPENLDLTILVHDERLARGYFRTAKQVEMPRVFPRFLYDQVAGQHGVVACEGSMFKSKFASALSTFMVEALGLAAVTGKLAIAYGGEAGTMDPGLESLVRRYVKDALVITRNEESQAVLGRLGVPTRLGTDTAWTFEPAPDDVGRSILRAHGWDGVTPVLVACPINPFWWPVRPDLARAAARAALGLHAREHYGSIYFHEGGDEVERKQEAYLDGLAGGIRAFARREGVFVVCVGMEQLDREACEALATRLGGAPVLASDEVEMFELVSVLRQATYQVSSRYHGVVTAMPAGVLSVGVTMDERIRNLFRDRGQPELALEVDDPDLAAKVRRALEQVAADPDGTRAGIHGSVVRGLELMGRMGTMLAGHVHDRLPGFPLPDGMGAKGDPWAHLPPLSPRLRERVETWRRAA